MMVVVVLLILPQLVHLGIIVGLITLPILIMALHQIICIKVNRQIAIPLIEQTTPIFIIL
jgi:hypothetical protein